MGNIGLGFRVQINITRNVFMEQNTFLIKIIGLAPDINSAMHMTHLVISMYLEDMVMQIAIIQVTYLKRG